MTDAAADGDVIEESDGWRIGHIQGQQYDFFTLLTYLATDVKMRGSGITDAQTGDDEQWRSNFDEVERSEEPVMRAQLTPRRAGAPQRLRVQISWTDPDRRRTVGGMTSRTPFVRTQD